MDNNPWENTRLYTGNTRVFVSLNNNFSLVLTKSDILFANTYLSNTMHTFILQKLNIRVLDTAFRPPVIGSDLVKYM
jgi:hypothetical protein